MSIYTDELGMLPRQARQDAENKVGQHPRSIWAKIYAGKFTVALKFQVA